MTIAIRKGKQLDGMRAAAEVAAEVLLATADAIKPGATTGEVDQFAAGYIARLGLKSAFFGYRGFKGNICILINEEVVHGIGGPQHIQLGDTVKIDVGVIKDGWIGDNAITVPVGQVDEKMHRLLYAAIEHAVQMVSGTLVSLVPAHRFLVASGRRMDLPSSRSSLFPRATR